MQNKPLTLTPASLPAIEATVCEYLSHFLHFSSHTLYFPDEPLNEILYIPGEKRAFLPLLFNSQFYGTLILDNVHKNIRNLIPHLLDITTLCLELAITRSALNKDQLTGLASENAFYHHMERIARDLENQDNGQIRSSFENLHKLCLGLIIITPAENILNNFRKREVHDKFLALADIIPGILPADALASLLGRYEGRLEYGIILPAINSAICKKEAERILNALEQASQNNSKPGQKLAFQLYAGCAIYPQDMKGDELRLTQEEQALLLRNRARLAAKHAARSSSSMPEKRVLLYNAILQQGGKVLEVLENGRLLVNIGRAANASEGMRFQTTRHGRDTGQIVLLETGLHESIAEILFTADGGEQPEAGDTLHRLSLENSAPETQMAQGIEWLGHGAFFKAFTCAKDRTFTLGLCRTPNKQQREKIMQEIENAFMENTEGQPSLLGQYGVSSLIFYHPDQNANIACKFYHNLAELGRNMQIDLASGLFEFPFLEYARQESESCVLKALEYGALLPYPHIGVLDSVALNISADKRSSLGDTFGAIREYELAIMVDKTNANAWNSLGVSQAALGKDEIAKRNFNEALKYSAETELSAKIYYNLGVLYQKSAEMRAARQCFRKCLENDPGHAYAWLRLSQIEDRKGKRKEARHAGQKALELSGQNKTVANAARRQLARIEIAGNNMETARTILHESLLADPNDAITLTTLAKLYLHNNEDPEMAELLAGKSLMLGGGEDAAAILEQARNAKR